MAIKRTERATDSGLFKALQTFVAQCPDQKLDRFRQMVADVPLEWVGAECTQLAASSRLALVLDETHPTTDELVNVFATRCDGLHWEQAYSATDGTVTQHMLDNYGYAEIIGKQGPFLSEKFRAGIAVYGPGIDYPLHRHQAEEIYAVIAGRASFRLGDSEPVERAAGEVIYHPSQMYHGLHTGDNTLLIFYLWHGGNLRETPSFDAA